MSGHVFGRRYFLKTLSAIGAAPIVSTFGSRLIWAADPAVKTAYDPTAKLELNVTEV